MRTTQMLSILLWLATMQLSSEKMVVQAIVIRHNVLYIQRRKTTVLSNQPTLVCSGGSRLIRLLTDSKCSKQSQLLPKRLFTDQTAAR